MELNVFFNNKEAADRRITGDGCVAVVKGEVDKEDLYRPNGRALANQLPTVDSL